MGFWQGVADAYKDIEAQKTREEELEQARADRLAEIESDRAFDREMFQKRLEETRRDTLFKLAAERGVASGDAEAMAAKTRSLAERLSGVEAPEDVERVGKILQNPAAAAEIYDRLESVEQGLAENDMPRRLTPSEILEGFAVISPGAGVQPVDVSIQDILDADLSDPGTAFDLTTRLSPREVAPPVIQTDPTLFQPFKGERLSGAEEAFAGEVMRRAQVKLSSLGEDAPEYADLSATIKEASSKGVGSAGMNNLISEFGFDAYKVLKDLESPVVMTLDALPSVQANRYSDRIELEQAAREGTPAEQDEAKRILRDVFGVNF